MGTSHQVKSIVVFTTDPWHNALPQLRITAAAEVVGISVIHGCDLDDIYVERIDQADLVVIQRDFPRRKKHYQEIITRARNKGIPVVFDIDDLIMELPEDHPDRGTLYYARAMAPMLEAIIEADLVTVSTAPLAEYIRELNPKVRVLPNCLLPDIWKFSPIRHSENSPVVIGYLGSVTHNADLKEIVRPLHNIASRFSGRVKLCFWGIQPPEELIALPNVSFYPIDPMGYRDFADYCRKQPVDIYIAPLANNPFNQCKSGIKFLEYSALGAPGIYSRLAPYACIVEDGVTGLLAGPDEEWENGLARLIENPADRESLAENAQALVRNQWMISYHANEWGEVYDSAEKNAELSKQQAIQLRLVRQTAYWQEQTVRLDIQDLRDVIAQREARIRQLEDWQADLYRSRAWNLVTKIWNLKTALTGRKGK